LAGCLHRHKLLSRMIHACNHLGNLPACHRVSDAAATVAPRTKARLIALDGHDSVSSGCTDLYDCEVTIEQAFGGPGNVPIGC